MIIHDKDTARKVAELLLQIKAIKLQPNEPFTWASGWKSPIYCDNRIALSFPNVRTFIRQALVKAIEDRFSSAEYIAGVATGAIAQAALVAQEMGKPMVYVRPEPKKHGMQNLIEGMIGEGHSVVVVEDLISTAGSSLKAVDALKDAGCDVKGMISVFTYGFDVADKNIKKAKCNVISLCDYNTLVDVAVEAKYITDKDVETLREWREKPDTWGV